MRSISSRALFFWALLTLAIPASAQIPDEFKNLQVFPKDIEKRQLVGAMRSFAGALGVRCKYCHVGPDNLQGMDFASDELPTKVAARQMLQMVKAINGDYLSKVKTDRESKVRVECVTCHRGVPVPMQIDDLIESTIKSQGVDAAIRRYEELRSAYYGRASYDFGPVPLNDLAERTFRAGDVDTALTLVSLINDLNPDYPWSRVLLGGIYKSQDKKDEAIAAYQEALKLDPENKFIQKQIDELTAPPSKE